MATERADLEAISARLRRLERRLWLWRVLGFGALALALIGAVAQRSSSLRATEFVLTDPSGATIAKLGVEKACATCSPEAGLYFLSRNGAPVAYFDGGALWLSSGKESTMVLPASLSETGKAGTALLSTSLYPTLLLQGCRAITCKQGAASLSVTGANSSLSLQDNQQEVVSVEGTDAGGLLSMWDSHGKCVPSGEASFCAPEVTLASDVTGPSLSFKDLKGYSTQIGVSDLVTLQTGETHKTSAASIVMFGNDSDHKVIWKAPLP